MAQVRVVQRVVTPQPVSEGGGVRLLRTIGSRQLDALDPFLLLDHFSSDKPADYQAGFPEHPHRGMETVTYMLAGRMTHRDIMGNVGRVEAGGVQWMTAGAGILHEEMPESDDGRLSGLQLWVNLPAAKKLIPPRYRGYAPDEIPEVEEQGARIRVIAGSVGDVRGPVRELVVPTSYLDVRLPEGRPVTLPVPREHTAFAYVLAGTVALGPEGSESEAPEHHLAVLVEGDAIRARAADGEARLLLIAGQPLGEPVARYGPFVMNTQEEIQEALRDLRRGTFAWRG